MNRNYKSFLVTGGLGFMGRDFIRLLLDKKEVFKVVCLDAMTYAGKMENINDFIPDERFTFIKGDILNQKLVEDILGSYKIDCLVHFAAESHVDRSIDSPYEFVETNVKGTVLLLEAVKKFPHVHFHHISTDEVYGALANEGAFTENTPYHPNSPYAASKAASDHFVLAYANTYGLKVTLSHASNNFGPYQLEEKLIPKFIISLVDECKFPLYGTGLNIREWTYVEDHSEAVYTILNKGNLSEVYNIGSGNEKSNIELLGCIYTIFITKNKKYHSLFEDSIQLVNDRKGHDFRYAIDPSKMKNLGWIPKFSLNEGLNKTVDYYFNKVRLNNDQKSNNCLHYSS